MFTVRQGKQSVTTTTTVDEESGIETIEWTIKTAKRQRSGRIDRDLKTGKLLPPEELRNPPKTFKELVLEQFAELEQGST
jgi:hypothetical protein